MRWIAVVLAAGLLVHAASGLVALSARPAVAQPAPDQPAASAQTAPSPGQPLPSPARPAPDSTLPSSTLPSSTLPAPSRPGASPAFPALTGRVVDEAGVLGPADRAALSDALAAQEARTGNQFVVATLSSLRGMTIEDYGYQLGRRWGIGRKDTSSGVLLIVAPNERAVRIEVGYGLEGTLTDAATKLIIETEILPRFRAGDLPGGIRLGAARIAQILEADAQASGNGPSGNGPSGNGPAPSLPTPVGNVPVWPIVLGGVVLVVLLIHCAVRGGALCQILFQILYMMALSGGGGRRSSNGDSPYSGGGGSFGGGGASGRW